MRKQKRKLDTPPSQRPNKGRHQARPASDGGRFKNKVESSGSYTKKNPAGGVGTKEAADNSVDEGLSPVHILSSGKIVRTLPPSEINKGWIIPERQPTMAGPTTEVLSADFKEFRGEFRKTADDVIRIGTEVGIFKWLIGLCLIFVLGGVLSGVWWGATLTSKASSLEDRVGKVETRLGGIETSLTNLDKRLDRIESSIKALAPASQQTRP